MSTWIFPTTGTVTQGPTFTPPLRWVLEGMFAEEEGGLYARNTLGGELLAGPAPTPATGITQVASPF